ncbi:MAG TPA: shikimate kinase [Bryobacteraceae bacterium]|jgi:shikimate kinase|nr:shikimate kinase [Bryobacteraceae bacterium]
MTLKLKRTPGLYLVGFMASGKSTIGGQLADELGWTFFDIDRDIEEQERRSIAEIFSEHGESAFREIETEMIRKRIYHVQRGSPCVFALGGGAFVQPRNWELIENNGVTIWLDCTLERVRRRLGDCQTRPLARDQNGLTKLYQDRRPLYSRADFRVEIESDDVKEVVQHILALPIF